ncbi:MAG: ATP-binding protein [Flavobacteriales bacterium]
MIKASKPDNENERLKVLHRYQILDSIDEASYDDIVLIASQICGMPISLISFIDEKRQWFKAKKGIDVNETERDLAYCSHAILNPNEIMEVKNADLDERFKDNPFNIQPPYVKFYAGAPLVTKDGYALGTLCVIDHKENSIDPAQKKALKALANQVMALLELRIKNLEIEKANHDLEIKNKQLKKVAYRISHDIKSSLSGIYGLSDYVFNYETGLSEDAKASILAIKNGSMGLQNFVKSILEFYTTAEKMGQKRLIDPALIAQDSLHLTHIPDNFQVKIHATGQQINTSEPALKMILVNLISNAIKYNDKEKGKIEIIFTNEGDYLRCDVHDNGKGIKQEDIPKILQPFTTLNQIDRFGNRGSGIGLFSVIELIDRLGGCFEINSEYGRGTTCSFFIPLT